MTNKFKFKALVSREVEDEIIMPFDSSPEDVHKAIHRMMTERTCWPKNVDILEVIDITPPQVDKEYDVMFAWTEYIQRHEVIRVKASSQEEAERVALPIAQEMVKCDFDLEEAYLVKEVNEQGS